MEDNSTSYSTMLTVARLNKKRFQRQKSKRIDYPDINPVEHLWATIKKVFL